MAEWLQCHQKAFWFFRVEIAMQPLVASVVHHAHMHGVGVQIDSAVEFVLSVVELHFATSSLPSF